MKEYQKRPGFLVILLLALAASVALLLVNLASCGGGDPEETPTPEPPTPEETPTPEPPTPEPTPTETATPTPNPYIFLPTDEQIEQITKGIEGNLPPEEETGHVPPPAGQVNTLRDICLALADAGLLLNPECVFNEAWATSYTLPDAGMVYQAVSLPTVVDGTPTDDWLRQVESWPVGLAIGGILVDQTTNFAEFSLPVGVYLVVLNNGSFELYNVDIVSVASGDWQLRQFNVPAPAPVALVTPDQLCFSELEMQACLNLTSPGLGEGSVNAEIVQTAVSNLQAAEWLPENFAVNTAGAMSSIEGVENVQACTSGEEQQSLTLESCFPSLVVAAAEPISDTISQAKPVVGAKAAAPSLQVTGLISEVVTGMGVMEVLEPLVGEVFDPDGQMTDLVLGSYRVDLLHLTDGTSLFQLISVEDTAFYLVAIPLAGEGELVETESNTQTTPSGDIMEPGPNEVLIDGVVWTGCQSPGWGTRCNTNRRWVYWCFTGRRAGWCYANGVFR